MQELRVAQKVEGMIEYGYAALRHFPKSERHVMSQEIRLSMWRLLLVMLPALCLILVVLGSILSGIATPTEAAGVGAAGALLIAALKGRLSMPVMTGITRSALIVQATMLVRHDASSTPSSFSSKKPAPSR